MPKEKTTTMDTHQTRLIKDRVREWRMAKAHYDELRDALVEGKKAEDQERVTRAQVGRLIDAPKMVLVVDGATVVYERGERAGPTDFESAWLALFEAATPALRKQMAELLQNKPPTILHKLTSA